MEKLKVGGFYKLPTVKLWLMENLEVNCSMLHQQLQSVIQKKTVLLFLDATMLYKIMKKMDNYDQFSV